MGSHRYLSHPAVPGGCSFLPLKRGAKMEARNQSDIKFREENSDGAQCLSTASTPQSPEHHGNSSSFFPQLPRASGVPAQPGGHQSNSTHPHSRPVTPSNSLCNASTTKGEKHRALESDSMTTRAMQAKAPWPDAATAWGTHSAVLRKGSPIFTSLTSTHTF